MQSKIAPGSSESKPNLDYYEGSFGGNLLPRHSKEALGAKAISVTDLVPPRRSLRQFADRNTIVMADVFERSNRIWGERTAPRVLGEPAITVESATVDAGSREGTVESDVSWGEIAHLTQPRRQANLPSAPPDFSKPIIVVGGTTAIAHEGTVGTESRGASNLEGPLPKRVRASRSAIGEAKIG